MTTSLKRLLRLTPIVLTMAFLLGNSRPAQAGCFISFADCTQRAAQEATYWRAVFATGDCELELVDCMRRFIIGR
jgi:hypothetical protein